MTHRLSIPHAQQVKALLIDMDGTLVDSLPTLFESYSSFLQHFDINGSHEEFLSLIGPSLKEIVSLLKERYQMQGEVTELLHFYQHGLIDAYRSKIRALPFVRETLEYAKVHDMKLAMVTSADKSIAEACLEGVGFAASFDVVITKQPGVISKPAPDLYLKALEILRIDAAKALAIEDSPSGVAAALAAGVYTLWLSRDSAPLNFPAEKYLQVCDWQAILSLLKGGRDA